MDKYSVKYLKLTNKEPIVAWLKSLDNLTRKRILQRFLRLEDGNFGDCKKINEEISEIRFLFGAGYRVYFTQLDDVILLLINGGDKSSQVKDIEKAKELLNQWRQNND